MCPSQTATCARLLSCQTLRNCFWLNPLKPACACLRMLGLSVLVDAAKGSACLPLGIALHFVCAFLLKSSKVLKRCIKLRLHTFPVCGKFARRLVKGCGLLGLVLHILLLGCLGYGILFGLSLVG